MTANNRTGGRVASPSSLHVATLDEGMRPRRVGAHTLIRLPPTPGPAQAGGYTTPEPNAGLGAGLGSSRPCPRAADVGLGIGARRWSRSRTGLRSLLAGCPAHGGPRWAGVRPWPRLHLRSVGLPHSAPAVVWRHGYVGVRLP